MQSFSAGVVAVLAFTVALVIMYKRRWQGSRFTVLLMLLAGFGVTAGGWVGDMLARLGEWLGGMAEAGTARLFGVAAPIVVIAVMVTWLALDLRDRKIHPVTPWLALALPTVLAVVGGVYIGFGSTALTTIGSGLGNFAGWLGASG
jgi:hypothetical protein